MRKTLLGDLEEVGQARGERGFPVKAAVKGDAALFLPDPCHLLEASRSPCAPRHLSVAGDTRLEGPSSRLWSLSCSGFGPRSAGQETRT